MVVLVSPFLLNLWVTNSHLLWWSSFRFAHWLGQCSSSVLGHPLDKGICGFSDNFHTMVWAISWRKLEQKIQVHKQVPPAKFSRSSSGPVKNLLVDLIGLLHGQVDEQIPSNISANVSERLFPHNFPFFFSWRLPALHSQRNAIISPHNKSWINWFIPKDSCILQTLVGLEPNDEEQKEFVGKLAYLQPNKQECHYCICLLMASSRIEASAVGGDLRGKKNR